MPSVAKIAAVAVVGVGLVAGIAYWESKKVDRVIAQGSQGPLSEEDWQLLDEHPDNPKLAPVIRHELVAASTGATCNDSFGRADKHLGGMLARPSQKTSDDESLRAIAHMMVRCNEPTLLAWTSRPPEDVVKALFDHELADEWLGPPNVLVDLLRRLGPKVDQNLVDVVVASTRSTPSSVDAYVTEGFPADGATFGTNAPPVPPATDTRLTQAFTTWLEAYKKALPPEVAAAMLRVLEHVTPPKLDAAMVDALALGNGVTLCQRLATPADADVITQHMTNANERAECLSALTASADVAKALADAKGRFKTLTDEAKQKAWADEQGAPLIAMGPRAIAPLRDALVTPDPAVRSVAARALAKLDAHQYAVAIAKSFREHVAGAQEAALAQTLLPEPPAELDAWFSMFSTAHEPTMRSAIATIRDKAKRQDFVPDLFVGLRDPHNADLGALVGDGWLLADTDGAAPVVAAMLAQALKNAGAPEKVDAPTKLLALKTLAAKGNAKDSSAAIEPFTSDATPFDEFTTKTDSKTGLVSVATQTKKTFGLLASEALAAVKAR